MGGGRGDSRFGVHMIIWKQRPSETGAYWVDGWGIIKYTRFRNHISFFNASHEFSLSNVRHIVELSRFVGSIWSKQTVRNIIYFKLVLSGYFYIHV